MKSLKFRYTDKVNTIIRNNDSNIEIIFESNNNFISKIIYRGERKYFYSYTFGYDIFNHPIYLTNYVRMLAKDGSAFLARVYVDGEFYAMRKKKGKPQIVFMKSMNGMFKNFQLGKDVIDAICYYNGFVSNDAVMIEDFFQKRPIKEFNESEYINSLNPEDRKCYLESRRIDEVISIIGNKNKINKQEVEDIAFYVDCMDEESEIRKGILDENIDYDLMASKVIPLIKKAKKYNRDMFSFSMSSFQMENQEYEIPRRYVFCNDDFSLGELFLNKDEEYVYDLFYFFLDEYEQIKEYLNKGIERVKKAIDGALPYFKKYLEDERNK